MGDLTVRRDKEIKAEIDYRGIRHLKRCRDLSHKEKKDILRSDKAHCLVDELRGQDGIKPSDVKYIRPLSTEMKQLVETLYNLLIM